MKPNDPIESVLFDLDNTLIDRTGGFRRFCLDLYLSNRAINQVSTEAEAVEFLVELDGAGLFDRYELFARIIARWPGAFPDKEEGVEFYMRTYPLMMTLTPPTERLLRDLRSRGVPLGIVTNGGSEMQWAKVRATGAGALADAVVVSGDLEFEKPNPRIFELALSKIDARPETTLFVGDNPDADIVGAAAVGMQTAWIRLGREWPHDDRRPDYTLDHVSAAREIVFD